MQLWGTAQPAVSTSLWLVLMVAMCCSRVRSPMACPPQAPPEAFPRRRRKISRVRLSVAPFANKRSRLLASVLRFPAGAKVVFVSIFDLGVALGLVICRMVAIFSRVPWQVALSCVPASFLPSTLMCCIKYSL